MLKQYLKNLEQLQRSPKPGQKAPPGSPTPLQRAEKSSGNGWVPPARAGPRATFAWASARGR
ncbi:unnamed protein product [Prunus armeniaca]